MQERIFIVLMLVVFAACVAVGVVRRRQEIKRARRGRSAFHGTNRFKLAARHEDMWSLN